MTVTHTQEFDVARTMLARSVSPVVVVPIYNAYSDLVRCLESLFAHTPLTHSILVVDDGGADRRGIGLLADIADRTQHHVVVYSRPTNGGFVRACNDAFELTRPNDVVVVNSDVVVGPEWLERLTAAACSSNMIATATTLTNYGTIVSVPHRNTPDTRLPGNLHPDVASKLVAQASLQLRPTIPTAVGHCFYVKRMALEAVGPFDEAFVRGYGEEVDFSQRAIQMGFRHVCADDVLTYHRGNASFGESARAEQLENEQLINIRYPWYEPAVQRASTDVHSPLAHAIDTARIALVGRRLGVDATCLGGFWAGTQTVTLETVIELARRTPNSPLTVFVPGSLQRSVAAILKTRENIELEVVHHMHAHQGTVVDVLYRPYQVSWDQELWFLRRHGRRVIVNQLDTIAWSNPGYFPSDDAWLQYRETTRRVLAVVDGIAFISEIARSEAMAEGLVAPGAPTEVVYCGTTSTFDESPVEPRMPFGFVDDQRPLVLCLGTSYHHKNRPFGVRLIERLVDRGFEGRLVLAGPNPPLGHSLGSEAEVLLRNPALRARIDYLGDLTESEKAWLYRRARLVVYPTCSEGFGLVPFEAARLGTPTLSSRQGSLDEILPSEVRTIDEFDLGAAVDDALVLLHDDAERAKQCAGLVRAADAFTWARTTEALLGLVDEVLRRPPVRVTASWGEDVNPWQDGTPQSMRYSRLVEAGFRQLHSLDTIRRAAVPPGSRRQDALRTATNWARRQSRKADQRHT